MSRYFVVVACLAGYIGSVSLDADDAPNKPETAPVPAQVDTGAPSKKSARDRLVTINYPVADLVVSTQADAGLNPNNRIKDSDIVGLQKLIERTVRPDSWNGGGSEARISPFITTLSLVIRQTQSAHDEIAELLGQIRRALDVQIVVELHCLRLPESAVPLVGAELQNRGIVLSAAEAHRLLKPARETSAVVAEPTLILLSGHNASIVIQKDSASPCEFGLKVYAEADADRRNVHLKLASPLGTPDAQLESVLTGAAASEGTLLFDITRLQEIARRANKAKPGSPLETAAVRTVLRAYESDASRTRDLLLVTPRIVVPKEREELIGVVRE